MRPSKSKAAAVNSNEIKWNLQCSQRVQGQWYIFHCLGHDCDCWLSVEGVSTLDEQCRSVTYRVQETLGIFPADAAPGLFWRHLSCFWGSLPSIWSSASQTLNGPHSQICAEMFLVCARNKCIGKMLSDSWHVPLDQCFYHHTNVSESESFWTDRYVPLFAMSILPHPHFST